MVFTWSILVKYHHFLMVEFPRFFLVVNNIISNYIPSNHDTTPIYSWWGVLSIPNVSPDFQKNWAEPADPIKDPHEIPVNSIKWSYLLDNISFYPHIYI